MSIACMRFVKMAQCGHCQKGKVDFRIVGDNWLTQVRKAAMDPVRFISAKPNFCKTIFREPTM